MHGATDQLVYIWRWLADVSSLECPLVGVLALGVPLGPVSGDTTKVADVLG